jgi:hypothetical protein
MSRVVFIAVIKALLNLLESQKKANINLPEPQVFCVIYFAFDLSVHPGLPIFVY